MEVEFIGMNGYESAQFPQMWPGFKFRTLCRIGVKSFVNFRFDQKVFLGFWEFPSSTETNISKFKIPSRSGYKKNYSESFPC